MRLAHSVFGSGPKKLVLAHPLASSGSFFADVVPLLGPEFSVLTFDARSMGRSDQSNFGSWQELIDDVVGLVDSVWGENTAFHFCGVSMGGMLAQHMAKASCSARLASVVLCSTTSSTVGQEQVWKDRIAQLANEKTLTPQLVELALARWFTAQCPGRDRERETLSNCSAAGYIQHAKLIASHDLQEQHFVCPVLVVCGSEDVGTNVAAHEKLAAQIKQAKLMVLSNLAHALPSQAPELFASILKNFIQ
jgi:pimeloyl-ACP methyl ester carboxylesterase